MASTSTAASQNVPSTSAAAHRNMLAASPADTRNVSAATAAAANKPQSCSFGNKSRLKTKKPADIMESAFSAFTASTNNMNSYLESNRDDKQGPTDADEIFGQHVTAELDRLTPPIAALKRAAIYKFFSEFE